MLLTSGSVRRRSPTVASVCPFWVPPPLRLPRPPKPPVPKPVTTIATRAMKRTRAAAHERAERRNAESIEDPVGQAVAGVIGKGRDGGKRRWRAAIGDW